MVYDRFTRTHILTNHGILISILDQTYPRIMVYALAPDVKNFSLNNKIISTGDSFITKRKIFNVRHQWVYDIEQVEYTYPRIMAKESSLEKKELPGMLVTVCFPALIRSGSTSLGSGQGPCQQNIAVLVQFLKQTFIQFQIL